MPANESDLTRLYNIFKDALHIQGYRKKYTRSLFRQRICIRMGHLENQIKSVSNVENKNIET